MKFSRLVFILILGFLLLPFLGSAHPAAIEAENLNTSGVFLLYLKLGFTHIIPLGLDHILFILTLFLLSPKLKIILLQATVFTLAHSITLAFSMLNIISTPSHITEPIIALSIMFVAFENIISGELRASRLLIVFVFGLIHGLGFAGVLAESGLPTENFTTALISFNLGVELGQVTIILASWYLFAKWFHKETWYRARVVNPVSAIIAVVALYWTLERTFMNY